MVSEVARTKITETINGEVLILVLVEDGLGEVFFRYGETTVWLCLNPCFSGGWSRSAAKAGDVLDLQTVLILVLVEDGLGEFKEELLQQINAVLILVLVEDGLGALLV